MPLGARSPARLHMPGAAPAVRYPAMRSHRLARALLVLAAAQLLTLLLYAVLSPSPSPASVAAQSLAAAAACALLLHFWRTQQPRELHWDGQLWRLQAAPGSKESMELAALDAALDTQHCLLLRCLVRERRRTLWLWLDADAAPGHWHALRCALYFPAGNPGAASPDGAAP